ncbi:uncharacterized [Tachysurus ichikawai]
MARAQDLNAGCRTSDQETHISITSRADAQASHDTLTSSKREPTLAVTSNIPVPCDVPFPAIIRIYHRFKTTASEAELRQKIRRGRKKENKNKRFSDSVLLPLEAAAGSHSTALRLRAVAI